MRSSGSLLQRRKKSNLCPDYTRLATGKLAARAIGRIETRPGSHSRNSISLRHFGVRGNAMEHLNR